MQELDTKQIFRASMLPMPESLADIDTIIARARRQRRRRRSVSVLGFAATFAVVSGLLLTGRIVGVGVGGITGQAAVGLSDDQRYPVSTAPYFRGIPTSVVSEVLSNATAQANIDILQDEERPRMWQGMALNFVFCREQFAAYQSWNATGVRPPTPRFTPPSEPVGNMVADWTRDYSLAANIISTGSLAELGQYLTGDASCGNWIPARPGDASGPTIGDVVRGARLPADQLPWPAGTPTT